MLTYTQQIKNLLCEKSWDKFREPEMQDNARFFLYGILLFSGEFGFEGIKLRCENSNILELCAFILINCFDADISISERKKNGSTNYTISMEKQGDTDKIISYFGYAPGEILIHRIKTIPTGDSFRYFLRGVFVACGSVHSPEKGCHAEFSTGHAILCSDLQKLLEQNGMEFKMTTRRSYHVLYCKGSEKIEDLLMLLGAESFAYDVINTRIEKSIKNNLNRVSNFETANLYKTIDAASISLSAIAYLREQGIFESLPPILKETAILREQNPELTLAELGMMFERRISKSGVNHRLNKIISIAREYSDYTLF